MEKQNVYKLKDKAAAIDKVIHELILCDKVDNYNKFLYITKETVDGEEVAKINVKSGAAAQEVSGERGNLLISDGDKWITNNDVYLLETEVIDNENYTEYRFGPQEVKVSGEFDTRPFVITNNPKGLHEDGEHTSNTDDKGYVFRIKDNAKMELSNNFTFVGNENGLTISNGDKNIEFNFDNYMTQRAIIKNLDNVPSTVEINNHEEIRINDVADKLNIQVNIADNDDEFYGLIVVKADFDDKTTAADFITGDVVLINEEIDITNYNYIHINIYYDGFNPCAVVSGYKK